MFWMRYVGGGLMAMGLAASAQAQMAPPAAHPTALPPLPAGHVTSRQPSEASQTSSGSGVQGSSGNTTPTPTSTNTVPAYTHERFWTMLAVEGERLGRVTEPDFHVMLMASDGDATRALQATGLVRNDLGVLAQQRFGLSGVMHMANPLQSGDTNTCYVLVNPQTEQVWWDRIVAPMAKVSHPQSGPAYLVGHAVGHCLDQWTRAQAMRSRLAWDAQAAKNIGLDPHAVRLAFGNTFSKDAFLLHPERVEQYPSQQEYSERVADAFGLMWLVRLGGNVEALNVAAQAASSLEGAAFYNTPVVDAVRSHVQDPMRMQRMDTLWDLARQLQVSLGVDQRAVDANAAMSPTAWMAPQERPTRWIVTPQGPVEVDDQGRPVKAAGTSAAPAGQNFNALPRFGAGGFGSGG